MRTSKKQAVRTNRSISETVVDVVSSVHSVIGSWIYVLGFAMLFAVGGGINSFIGPSDASDHYENVPDNISEACWAKRVRSAIRETSVDRYEREQAEEALKSAEKCTEE